MFSFKYYSAPKSWKRLDDGDVTGWTKSGIKGELLGGLAEKKGETRRLVASFLEFTSLRRFRQEFGVSWRIAESAALRVDGGIYLPVATYILHVCSNEPNFYFLSIML
jgi:hypothetical protein